MLNKNRLFTPGPTALPERVRLAMARDMIHHRKAEFKALMAGIQEPLGELFGTAQPVLPLSASGTGAMAAAVCALFAPGNKVLVVEGGKFGMRWSEICRMHGVDVSPVVVEWGQGVEPAAVAAALDADPALCAVLVQHSETSTGAAHPVKQLAAITRQRDVLLVVDGISAVSIMPCPMDAWGIDCLLTGSQKGLMLPPGLALVALSERAWNKAETVAPRNFYFNLLKERDNALKAQTHFTSPVSLIVGLAESLAMFTECGLDNIYRKQWALSQMTRACMSALGLRLFAPQSYAWGLTSVLLPAGVAATDLLARAAEDYGAFFAAGPDEYKQRMVRIGHMGWLDYGDMAAGLRAFARSFTACGGHIGCRNYLEQALDAYDGALQNAYPQ